MARPESASVPIWLKLSEVDAAKMERVLARPEFAGWTRAEWCLEIIQTALRYYTKRPMTEPGRERAPARPAAAEPEPATPVPEPEPEPAAPEPARAAPEPEASAPEPAAQPECSHPADARNYETGTCAACGAILWD